MNDPGFDAYLDLLARFLRLGAQQREEIRRELRAHVEEALDAELERGLPRDEALRNILMDFGDAAELAARFRSAQQRRRWIMHTTLTAACVGFLTLVGSFLVRTAPPAGAASGTIESSPAFAQRADAATELTSHQNGRDVAIRKALEGQLDDVDFADTPAQEAFEFLRKAMNVNVHVSWAELSAVGINQDQHVTLKLKNLPAGRVLKLLLESLSPEVALDYAVEDGVLMIAPAERLANRQSIVIYDVRAFTTTEPDMEPNYAAADDLAELIQETVDPDSWSKNGGRGRVKAYRTNLVVVQSGPVHARVAAFMQQLRAVVHVPVTK